MKKVMLMLVTMMFSISLLSQTENHMFIHNSGTIIYDSKIAELESIYFQTIPCVMQLNDQISFPLSLIDSITFGSTTSADTVFIIFSDNSVIVDNPFVNQGVEVNDELAHVSVNASKQNVVYKLSGSSANGSIIFSSAYSFMVLMHDLTLTSDTGAAICVDSNVDVMVDLEGNSVLSDADGAQSGAFTTEGSLFFAQGIGSLSINGNAKHGIYAEKNVTIASGSITINADSDAIHANSFAITSTAEVTVVGSGSDGIDCSGDVTVAGGSLTIYSTAADVKAIKSGNNVNITLGVLDITVTGSETKAIKAGSQVNILGGEIDLNLSGDNCNGITADALINIVDGDLTIVSSAYNGKAVKSDDAINISGGALNITVSGNISKGIKSAGFLTITDGDFIMVASGGTELELIDGVNVPSYCTAIKSDTDIVISGGDFSIELPETNDGGKAISADGEIVISGGVFDLRTYGSGATYVASGTTKDSYTSSCLKSDGNMRIINGTLTCSSTGLGGKCISSDGTLILGDSLDNSLIINATTSGDHFLVAAGSGGWGPPHNDYANPKAIKSQGDLMVNGGSIVVNCTQSTEGGECLESKANLIINKGDLTLCSKKDDCISTATTLVINGGTLYCKSEGNDGIDSNGPIWLNGGMSISQGASVPECGIDCDNNQLKITGGVIFGVAGDNSNPTASVCTQYCLNIQTSSNSALQIIDDSNNVIMTYQCPTISSGGGGGGGPGGGSGVKLLFSDPDLHTGAYTIKYGGTITGGTEWHGYFENATYSGGQTKSFTISNMVTSVNAH